MRDSLWDRLSASDPGFLRLSSATVPVGGVLLTLLVLGATGAPAFMLLIAAWSSMVAGYAVNDTDAREKVLTLAIAIPVSILALTAGTVLAPYRVVADIVLLVFIFGAMYMRRYGPRGSALGELASQHFFMAQFIHATVAQIPGACLFVIVAIGCSALIGLVVVGARPQRTLKWLQWAFCARLRVMTDAMIDLISVDQGSPAGKRCLRALQRHSARLHQVALLIQSWLETGVNDDGTAHLVRRIAEAEIAVERLAVGLLQIVSREPDSISALTLHLPTSLWTATGTERSSRTREPVDPAIDHLLCELQSLRQLIPRPAGLRSEPAETNIPGHLLAYGCDGQLKECAGGQLGEVYFAVHELAHALLGLRPALGMFEDSPRAGLEKAPPHGGQEAEASTNAGKAESTLPTGLKRPTTRAACQATVGSAIALIGGEIVSPEHWYWAMITCWVVFINTSSIGEVLVKGYRRLAGTVMGVAGGTGLVALVTGNAWMTFALMIVCMFGAFLTASVSYLLMSFLVTAMLGLAYAMLGTYNEALLLVRIEETALGIAAGMIAALLVLPSRTRHRTDEQLAQVLQGIRLVVDQVVTRLGGGPRTNVLAAARELDAALDEFRILVQPFVHPVSPLRARRSRTGYILGVLQTCAYHARTLAAIAEHSSPCDPHFLDAAVLTQARKQFDDHLATIAAYVKGSSWSSHTRLPLVKPALTTTFPVASGWQVRGNGLGAQVLQHLWRLDANILSLARPLGLTRNDFVLEAGEDTGQTPED